MVELAAILALAVYSRQHTNRCRREIARYLENVTGTVDTATKDTMANSPLPMIIFRPESDDIIWTNDRFLHLAGEKEHLFDAKLSSVIPDFDTRWLMEGKNECPTEVTFGPRRFLVYGHLVRASGREGGFLATTYWVDTTEADALRETYTATRPVLAILMVDNYEDLMKACADTQRSAVLAQVDEKLSQWAAGRGLLLKIERDRYLFIFGRTVLSPLVEEKFSVLDAIRDIKVGEGSHPTLSIGIGKDADSMVDLYKKCPAFGGDGAQPGRRSGGGTQPGGLRVLRRRPDHGEAHQGQEPRGCQRTQPADPRLVSGAGHGP